MATKKVHEKKARTSMKNMGIYKTEFSGAVAIYADLRAQYDALTKMFVESDYEFEIATKEGSKKAPIVTTLESLRKDILAYASQLGLTPQGLLKADDKAFAKKKKSPLEDLLKGIGSG